jgi:hypothetical protein
VVLASGGNVVLLDLDLRAGPTVEEERLGGSLAVLGPARLFVAEPSGRKSDQSAE